ncbi:peptidase [Pilimelia anulata]|uniref:Peptidase n=1 Tax=Pilimelia anulata TaxID=53371 RepID=A0A8J3B6L8_9ACTN|nr:alpha/beta hydrolase [Pilimelia anulata]GGJ91872.1 peptidase [Pilimelia anulata]
MRTASVIAGVAAAALALGTLGAPVAAAPPPAAPRHDTTSPEEARRVDGVATPRLYWKKCRENFECAEAALPLDYDRPRGGLIKIGLLRARATDPANRIGSLLFNPGGPGGSGMDVVEGLADAVPDLRARFDLIGFDPRGIGESDVLRCLPEDAERERLLTAYYSVSAPLTAAQRRTRLDAARTIGRACGKAGKRTAAAMHTAQVARDMDVLRRALGDAKLNYLGFSYGSILGQYYANLFPDRFRALVIDGVVDAREWVGTPASAGRPVFDRIGSAAASHEALTEYLRRCAAAGARCRLAATGDPVGTYDDIAGRLHREPVVIDKVPHGYQDLVLFTARLTYSPYGMSLLDRYLADLYVLTRPGDPAAQERARRSLGELFAEQNPPQPPASSVGVEATYGVMCGDADNTSRLRDWPELADAAAARAGHLGRFRANQDDICAADAWTAPAHDRYTGPFNRRTAAPVLVSGNRWDPATAYRNARTVHDQLPGSLLLETDSWGHLAYPSSVCAVRAIDAYLLTGAKPPAAGCADGWQPFGTDKAAPARPLLPVPPLPTL